MVVNSMNRERVPPWAPLSLQWSPTYTWNYVEELALESAPSRPRLWKQYVDDTCCILRKGDVDGLLHHLNSIHPTIFTMEVEEGGGGSPSFPITRKEDGKLDITVYRKQMHMDRYLDFLSNTCEEGLSLRQYQVH